MVSSGGIRVNEGTLALFQMIKMSAAINQHNNKRLLYICVLDGPTLGGTSASLAALADIIVARMMLFMDLQAQELLIKLLMNHYLLIFKRQYMQVITV